jgi:hypothetical protein
VLGRLTPTPARLAVAATLLTLVGTTVAADAAVEYPGPVDAYASYQGENGCRDRPMKGTKQLAAWITKKFAGGTANASMRACSSSTSEHQDGRAIDWTMDAAKEADRAEVDRFLTTLFATDGDGEEHALARRMGIMYVIWNDHMYRAYGNPHFAKDDYLSSSCPSRKKCSKTLRHRDHVHISLSRPGGKAETTWYNRTTTPAP